MEYTDVAVVANYLLSVFNDVEDNGKHKELLISFCNGLVYSSLILVLMATKQSNGKSIQNFENKGAKKLAAFGRPVAFSS